MGIELGEFDIEYHPHPAIKGHVLVDFFVETPQGEHQAKDKDEIESPTSLLQELPPPLPFGLKFYVNKASGKGISGVGILIISS